MFTDHNFTSFFLQIQLEQRNLNASPHPNNHFIQEQFSWWHSSWPPELMKLTLQTEKNSSERMTLIKDCELGADLMPSRGIFQYPLYIYIKFVTFLFSLQLGGIDWAEISRKCIRELNRGEPVVIVASHSSIKITDQKEKIKAESILTPAHSFPTLWWCEQSVLCCRQLSFLPHASSSIIVN